MDMDIQERVELLKRAEQAEAALSNLLKRHTGLVESGDCGNWDVNNESEVQEAKRILGMA